MCKPKANSSSSAETMYPVRSGVVNIVVETKPDEQGRQRFWCYWLQDGRKRGQIFFTHLQKAIQRWKDAGDVVNVSDLCVC